jgi:uncharacterized iron-regulated membrane protein
LFFLVLGLTGSIMAFEPELDRLIHAHLSYVKPSGSVLSLSEIGEVVSKRFNGEPIVAYLPSESPDLSSEVILPSGIVCVNQYTGEVLGTRKRGQTIFGLARDLHVRVESGDVGRSIMKWSGLALLVSLVSGPYLWWPMKRIGIPGGWRSGRFWFDLHNSLGIVLLVPLVVLGVTGTILGFEDQAAAVLDRIPGTHRDHERNSTARPQPAAGASPITPDQAVAIARGRIPGAIPNRVQMPRYGGAYRVSLDDPNDKAAGNRNLVLIDQYSGSVISSTRSGALSATERILATNEAIHTGEALGMTGRIVAWLTSIILPVQVISGLWMWLRRKGHPRPDRITKGAP